ncbi:hypothetical protein CSB69_3606 [Morganella morganii]|nr:hypothetical protein CSB69_3606 [Morganella morganii]
MSANSGSSASLMIRDRLFFIFVSPRDAILFLSGVQGNHAFRAFIL